MLTLILQKLCIGSHSLELVVSPDTFRNELYASTTANSTTDFTLTALISHRAHIQTRRQDASAPDEALAQLQQSRDLYHREKQAKQTNFTNSSLLAVPTSRLEAAKKERAVRKPEIAQNNGRSPLPPASSSLAANGTATSPQASPMAPVTEEQIRLRSMKKVVLHLLAIKPLTLDNIQRRTQIPRLALQAVLEKTAKPSGSMWQLSDRAHQDLDVWAFAYTSTEQRQSAIDNAIKAFDRLRLSKDDGRWQTLLPEKERGTGIVLSKLRLTPGSTNSGLTPRSLQASPLPAANIGGGHTPRPANSKSNVVKRLLSKDPKRARAIEEAREKKRKVREVPADENTPRPNKRPATAKNRVAKSNFKSAEMVMSSDDEDDNGKLTSASTQKGVKKSGPSGSSSNNSSGDASQPSSQAVKPAAAKKPDPTPASPQSTSRKPAPSPLTTPYNGVNSDRLRSPTKNTYTHAGTMSTRPHVPSPLGAARPRLASDFNEGSLAAAATGLPRKESAGAAAHETARGPGTTEGSKSDTTRPRPSAGPPAPRSPPVARDPAPATTTPSSASLSPATASPPAPRPAPESHHIALARKFRDKYYPAYDRLYSDLLRRQAAGEHVADSERRRLWKMHLRLSEIKEDLAKGRVGRAGAAGAAGGAAAAAAREEESG